MILSSPRSQTPTLATANIQFQNSIMLITHDNIGLRKDLFCALTNGQTGCSARRISALYVSLKGPSSRFLRDRQQEISIYQPPHKYINHGLVAVSDDTNIFMQSMFLSWGWQITAPRQRTAVCSEAIWTEESLAGTSTSGSTIQCSGHWSPGAVYTDTLS